MRVLRFRIRTFLVAVAVLTVLMQWVVLPAWDFYSLPAGTRSVLTRLQSRMAAPPTADLIDFLKAIRLSSPDGRGVGIPIYVDPAGLHEAETTLEAPLKAPPGRGAIEAELRESLRPLGLGYYVEDGLLTITSEQAAERALRERPRTARR